MEAVRRAWQMLESFLTAYPEAPPPSQASFSAANALLELRDYPAHSGGLHAVCRPLSAERAVGQLLVRDRLLSLRRRAAQGGVRGNLPQGGRDAAVG